MPSALDRIDYAPPRDVGAIRSFGLALLIHAALIAALTWGVSWKRSDNSATFGAELWSSLPSDAAPVVQIAPTTPAPPEPPPAPVVKPTVGQAPLEPTPSADITLEQDKNRKQLKDQKLAQEKLERDKAKTLQAQLDKAKLLKAEQLKTEQLKAEQLKSDRLKASQTAKVEQARAEAQKEALKARQSQQSADNQREDNLKRLNEMMTNAGGGTPGSSASGGTSRASAGGKGTSTTYGAIATAAVKPNVVFTEAFEGNPLAKIEVRLQLDGTIISSRVVQASGNANWDKAVLNAVIRTGRMPKDVDGKLPDTILILEFKPRF